MPVGQPVLITNYKQRENTNYKQSEREREKERERGELTLNVYLFSIC